MTKQCVCGVWHTVPDEALEEYDATTVRCTCSLYVVFLRTPLEVILPEPPVPQARRVP